MSEHTIVTEWGLLVIRGTPEELENFKLQFENERLRSMLKNARNVLRDGGYLYAKEIDKVLENSP